VALTSQNPSFHKTVTSFKSVLLFAHFQLRSKVNQTDDRGLLPLDLALSTKQEELANTLLEHKADVNLTDSDGLTLLHLAVARSKSLIDF
jgi:ankyrin repeat protein